MKLTSTVKHKSLSQIDLIDEHLLQRLTLANELHFAFLRNHHLGRFGERVVVLGAHSRTIGATTLDRNQISNLNLQYACRFKFTEIVVLHICVQKKRDERRKRIGMMRPLLSSEVVLEGLRGRRAHRRRGLRSRSSVPLPHNSASHLPL